MWKCGFQHKERGKEAVTNEEALHKVAGQLGFSHHKGRPGVAGVAELLQEAGGVGSGVLTFSSVPPLLWTPLHVTLCTLSSTRGPHNGPNSSSHQSWIFNL